MKDLEVKAFVVDKGVHLDFQKATEIINKDRGKESHISVSALVRAAMLYYSKRVLNRRDLNPAEFRKKIK